MSTSSSRSWVAATIAVFTAGGVIAAWAATPTQLGRGSTVADWTLLGSSLVSAGVIAYGIATGGSSWRHSIYFMVISILAAVVSVALLVRDLEQGARYAPVILVVVLGGFSILALIGARSEFVEHFYPTERREISVDVALLGVALGCIGYVLIRPGGADARTSVYAAIIAAGTAAVFAAYFALALWLPSPSHLVQSLIFSAMAANGADLGHVWLTTRTGGATGSLFPLSLELVALGSAAAFIRETQVAGSAARPRRLGRALLTSTAVAAACAALWTVATLQERQGVGRQQTQIMIAILAGAIAVRILVNQIRSTTVQRAVERALEEKEAALAEADLALDRVRQGTETLRSSQEHLELVFEAAVDGIVELDPQDVVVQVNEAFCRMVGLPREAIEGQPWTAIAATVAGADGSFASLPSTQQGTIDRQGQPMYLESRVSEIPADPPRRLLLVRDVTAGRVADQTIRSLFQFLQDRDEDRTRIMRRTNTAIEAERNRMARDLHDGPVQGVSAASLSLEAALLMIKAGDIERGLEVLGKVRRELSEEADSLRTLMSGLRPPLLEERGLMPALRETILRFGHDHDVHTSFGGSLAHEVPRDLETLAYRVVQEALSNAGKHARASSVTVHVETQASQLRIEIADDGAGFDAGRVREFLHSGRVGLASMRERVELAGGTFVVHSNPGKGTTIIATMPLAASRELARS
jgi:PAS domain S-box-containing protein